MGRAPSMTEPGKHEKGTTGAPSYLLVYSGLSVMGQCDECKEYVIINYPVSQCKDFNVAQQTFNCPRECCKAKDGQLEELTKIFFRGCTYNVKTKTNGAKSIPKGKDQDHEQSGVHEITEASDWICWEGNPKEYKSFIVTCS